MNSKYMKCITSRRGFAPMERKHFLNCFSTNIWPRLGPDLHAATLTRLTTNQRLRCFANMAGSFLRSQLCPQDTVSGQNYRFKIILLQLSGYRYTGGSFKSPILV